MREIFFAACERSNSHRDEYLSDACGSDHALRAEVESMLAFEGSHPEFLRGPVIDGEHFERLASSVYGQLEANAATPAPAAPAVSTVAPGAPASIGPYRVIRVVAEGGMGMVYEAEQDSPRRRVAIKVIRPGFLSRHAERRFEQEVQLLGRLHHPGIAQIFQAGVVETASPSGHVRRQRYFAMEFVEGVTLTAHAEEQNLNTRARLQLLARIAEAVQYGHERGVIHRDLKPANILVSPDGQPKVIDFGVARAADHEASRLSLQTNTGQLLGTLAYMSPEQVSGDPGAVNVASDVYALGVVGYELLSGRLPYDVAEKNLPEAARIICADEPSRMSSISRAFRGDIETIIGRALEKEPARRYASAGALAADIHRFLADEPIQARPPSKRYQLMKFARRHRELVWGLALVMLTLVAGIVGVSVALARSIAHQQTANAAAEQAQRLNASMRKIFESARPGTSGGGRMTVDELLSQSAAQVLDELHDAPELEIAMRRTLGQTYARLGAGELAMQHFQAAVNLAEARYGLQAIETHDVASEVGMAIGSVPKEQVQTWVERTHDMLAAARTLVPLSHPTVQRLLYAAASVETNQWRPWNSESHLRELLAMTQALPEAERAFDQTEIQSALVFPLMAQYKFEEAVPLARHLLATIDEGPPSAQSFEQRIAATACLAMHHRALRQFKETEAMHLDIVHTIRTVLGDNNPRTAVVIHDYADFLTQVGRFEEALHWRQLQRQIIVDIEHDMDFLSYVMAYEACLLDQLNRTAEARARMTEAIARRASTHGPDWLAREWWRKGVLIEGGLSQPWASDAMRRHVKWHVERELRAHAPAELDVTQLRWDDLTFALRQWNGIERLPVATGNLEQLHTLDDPLPGLYWLGIEAPFHDGTPLAAGGWILISDWHLDLRMEFRQVRLDLWTQPVQLGDSEVRAVHALVMENDYVDSFGPAAVNLSYAIEASTTITVPPGRYRIHIESDDGSRVFLNGEEVIDAWTEKPSGQRAKFIDVDLDGSPHELKVRYFQHGQDGFLRLHLEPLEPPDALDAISP